MQDSPQPRRHAAWYALRRTLPPWSFAANLAELVDRAGAYGLDEVIVKVDTEEFHHGHGILDWLRAYQPCLHRVRDALHAVGVVYSLNPWITIGHGDRGRDSIAQLPGLQTVVAHDGTQATNRACPLSPVWRENVRQLWTLYAETRPHVIWLEDDIKFHLGGGCFCPLHLAAFAERAGRAVGRAELVEAVNAPGEPHPWRELYLTLLADTVIAAARFLRETVHAVSPETCMGLMSSGPRSHCRSGHRWPELARVLAGDRPLHSRPPLGSYSEGSLLALYQTQDSIKITRQCIGANAIDQTEVENFPFSRYSKSTAFTFLQMAVSFAYGARGVTLNLFDHMGRPMEATPEFGRMLGERKPFLDALAARAQKPGVIRGVQLLHRDTCGMRMHVAAGSRFTFIEPGFHIAELLEGAGIPTTFDDSPVVAVEGQIVRALNDTEIRRLLAGGLLLDGVAAAVLVERGFGAHIGMAAVGAPTPFNDMGALAAEEWHDPHSGGAPRTYLTTIIPTLARSGRFGSLQPLAGAREISRLVDADGQPQGPASVVFENTLGGRVFVMGHDLSTCHTALPGMLSPERQRLLHHVQRWLGRDEPPVRLEIDGVYPLLLRKDCGDETLVGAFNLTLDPWPGATFVVRDARVPAAVERLAAAGAWVAHAPVETDPACGVTRLHSAAPVPCREPLFFAIRWRR